MATTSRPALVLLDVNETLSDLTPLRQAFGDAGLPDHEVDAWFAGVLRDGFALAAMGTSVPFAEVAAGLLEVRLAAAAAPDPAAGAAEVMAAFGRLRPHPDVAPGLLGLTELGCRVATLSNGSADVARRLLSGSAAGSAVEAYLSVDDAPRWKPAPEAYRFALEHTGVTADRAMLAAVHPWDVAGARQAGLRTAWVNRSGGRYPGHLPPAELEVASLTELAGVLA
jgi:2-haloacid dehalogenase